METAEFDFEFDFDDALPADETLRILDWRQSRFLALGYPLDGATLLACAPVDVHEIEHLIERGCPLDLAVKIAA